MTLSDMQAKQNDMTPEQAHAALLWLIEMGANEIVSEQPVNRFLSVANPAPPPATRVTPSALPSPARPKAAPAIRREATGGKAPNASLCNSVGEIISALLLLDECPLKRTASNLCFADGNLEAPVMVIGDVPGRDEDIEGKVFAGGNGLLLERMLKAIGLSLDNVSLFNFIPWRPPGNRAATEAEVAICQPYIQRAIELCGPSYILCLGQLPMQRLLGRSESLMSSRGKWFELRVATQKIPLLASFHPTYLTLQTAQKRLAWRDLLTFKEALDG
jgi:uracil-DNA glycosylase family 4